MGKVLSLGLLLIFVAPVYSQLSIRYPVSTPVLPDSADISYYSRKNGLRAGAMVVGTNVGLWAFDRYAIKGDYAYINFRTIKDNFRNGFVMDNDQMGTNMFLHPYHGNTYFNAARSNGYNFWQSGIYAAGGSLMWEFFMECEYPSSNDFIATPIGGMALGEVFYRASDLILNDRKTGGNRIVREAAAFLVSPMRGLTRLMTGDAWRRRPTTGRQFGIPDVSVEVSAGIRAIELRDEVFDQGVGFTSEFNMEYGDRFDGEGHKPYDYFSFKANVDIQASQPLLGQLNIIGRLWGKDVADDKKKYLNIGIYQHFDYYDSDTISDLSAKTPYKFCTPASVGVGVVYKNKRFKRWDVDAFGHVNAVLLGGALSDYYRVDDRNYNIASGFSTKVGFNFVYKKDKFAASTTYDVYRMYTWKGYPKDMDWNNYDEKKLDAQGDPSRAILHAVGLRLDLKLRDRLYLTSSFFSYTRRTNYRHYENVFSQSTEGRLMLTYKL